MAKGLPSHLSFSTNPETGKDEYYCTPCKRTFYSRTQKYYHYNCNDDEKKKHKCEQCRQSFSTRSHLNYHLESHQNATYKCSDCYKVFSNSLVFEKHKKLHRRNVLFDCALCQKTFRNKESLTAHKARHENTLSFECSNCDKKYATKSALEQHKLKHLAKKHKCPHCEKYFQRNSILNVHLKRHNQNEFFVCTTCFKKFADAGALERHSKTSCDKSCYQERYKCKECTKCAIFTRKDNIKRHVRNMHVGKNFDNCVEILRPGKSLEAASHKILTLETLESTDQNLSKTERSSVIKFVGNVEPIIVAPQETPKPVNELAEARTFTILKTVKIVDDEKKYDPIEMYRKILIPDERDEPQEHDHVENDIESTDPCEPVMAKRSNTVTSDFSAMHWRKNFKHTYTQHQGY